MKVDARSGLTGEQVADLGTKLLEARQAIIRRGRRPSGDGDPLQQGSVLGDAADQAETSFEQELSAELSEADRHRLRDIEDALARIDQGGYGICEGSGEPIGLDRLQAQPWARYTSAYQEKLESAVRSGPPPSL